MMINSLITDTVIRPVTNEVIPAFPQREKSPQTFPLSPQAMWIPAGDYRAHFGREANSIPNNCLGLMNSISVNESLGIVYEFNSNVPASDCLMR